MSCLAWSPHGGELLLGTVCGTVMRYDTIEQRLADSKQTGHKRGICLMLWTADDIVVLASPKLVSTAFAATAIDAWSTACEAWQSQSCSVQMAVLVR